MCGRPRKREKVSVVKAQTAAESCEATCKLPPHLAIPRPDAGGQTHCVSNSCACPGQLPLHSRHVVSMEYPRSSQARARQVKTIRAIEVFLSWKRVEWAEGHFSRTGYIDYLFHGGVLHFSVWFGYMMEGVLILLCERDVPDKSGTYFVLVVHLPNLWCFHVNEGQVEAFVTCHTWIN